MPSSLPWVEKYRPKTLDEVIGQDHVIRPLKEMVRRRDFNHSIFWGPVGTGKTSVAHCVGNELYGKSKESCFLDLSLPMDRGIETIREVVVRFARIKLFSFPFKIVFFDEAESLTHDAQTSLRRVLERYSGHCKFIFATNVLEGTSSEQIIPALQSRCYLFKFNPISIDTIEKRLWFIVENEKVEIEHEAVKAIAEISSGDLRKAINRLEQTSLLGRTITLEDVITKAEKAIPIKDERRKFTRSALLEHIESKYPQGGMVTVKEITHQIKLSYPETSETTVGRYMKQFGFKRLKRAYATYLITPEQIRKAKKFLEE